VKRARAAVGFRGSPLGLKAQGSDRGEGPGLRRREGPGLRDREMPRGATDVADLNPRSPGSSDPGNTPLHSSIRDARRPASRRSMIRSTS
jgi:hypothetical protein